MKKLLLFIPIFSLLTLTPPVCANEKERGKILLSQTPFTSSLKSREEYFTFLATFPGWTENLMNNSFPASSFNNCIDNQTVQTRKIRYHGRKGIVNGWLVRPQPKPGIKVPLVIYNRGGNAKWGKLIMADLLRFCQLAEQGYAVLASDFRGNNQGEGEDKTDLGYGDVYDSLDLIQVAEELKNIDTSRLAIWGFSRGTQITAMMLNQLTGVKAVIMSGTSAGAGSIGANRRRAEFDEHVYPLLIPNWQQLPKEKQDKLLSGISPLKIMDNIKSKTNFLFLHGAKDKRTPVEGMLQYVSALHSKGHTIELQLFSEASHWLHEVRPKTTEHIIHWLNLHLKPDDSALKSKI